MKVIITMALLLLISGTAFADTKLTVPQYSRFEGAFTVPGQSGNPFDPTANDVDVDIDGPAGKSIVPAFWDGTGWKVRFTPTSTGAYSATVRRNGRACDAQWSTPSTFKCAKSKSAGFVRRSTELTQGFAFDNGEPFYPIGMNLAWLPNDDGKAYEEAFTSMNANGMRWARVWMTFWDDKALEWRSDGKNPAIGELSLDSARKLDRVVDAAGKEGVYIQLVLQHHGQYTTKTDPNWSQNPFNVANGGFLKEPQDFFTDPKAIALTKAKYRYIVARWGYSPNIMAYELFNEVQNISEAHPDFSAVVNWHRQMADYLRSIDVDHHMVTASYTNPGNDLSKAGFDYLQIHDYVPDILTYFSTADYATADRPVFVGEWGSNHKQTEQTTHDGVWSSIFTNGAAPGMFWYWDQVQAQNWWPSFKSASTYLSRFGVHDQRTKTILPVVVDSPGKLSKLQFAFPGGWDSTKSFDIDLLPTGGITGLAGVSSFVQGNGHRDMTSQPILFRVHSTATGRFSVRAGRISANGAHPTLLVDGMPAVDRDYPGMGKDVDGNDTLGANLSPGEHTVSLFNNGPDWFTVDSISVDNYVPALAAFARTDGHTIDFWAYNRNRESTDPIDGTLTINNQPDGRYKIRYWDTTRQVELSSTIIKAVAGDLVIPIHGLVHDWAGTATRE